MQTDLRVQSKLESKALLLQSGLRADPARQAIREDRANFGAPHILRRWRRIPTLRHGVYGGNASQRRDEIASLGLWDERRAMNSQDLLAQRRVHAGQFLDEQFRPGLPKKDLPAKMEAGRPKCGGEIGERNFLPEGPVPACGFVHPP